MVKTKRPIERLPNGYLCAPCHITDKKPDEQARFPASQSNRLHDKLCQAPQGGECSCRASYHLIVCDRHAQVKPFKGHTTKIEVKK